LEDLWPFGYSSVGDVTFEKSKMGENIRYFERGAGVAGKALGSAESARRLLRR